jgi:hypothetical protein
MAKLTIGFGVVLFALGAWGFFGTGSAHPTALIPSYFGIALAICGALARTDDTKQRMLWMHVAVTVGLLGFLGAGSRAVVEFVGAHGEPLTDVAAVAVRFQVAMAAVCAVYVGLCVRSFITARRGGKLTGPAGG